MSLQEQVMEKMKEAMKKKNTIALTALRALKAAFLLAKTESGATELTAEQELKIIQKQVKQRKDSAGVFKNQNREDLVTLELAEAAVLEEFLPEALTEQEIEKVVIAVIKETSAEGMKDMGKVMGLVSKKIAGRADGKTISGIVRKNLI